MRFLLFCAAVVGGLWGARRLARHLTDKALHEPYRADYRYRYVGGMERPSSRYDAVPGEEARRREALAMATIRGRDIDTAPAIAMPPDWRGPDWRGPRRPDVH